MGTVFDNASGNRFTELLVASTMTHPPAFAASCATRSFSRVLEGPHCIVPVGALKVTTVPPPPVALSRRRRRVPRPRARVRKARVFPVKSARADDAVDERGVDGVECAR